eukprot:gnl/TRDRNA2_/TRDRNA2_90752_c0_seq2.p1 gnl/TRDRNA2_/TRDRNA2_90752_c0~~gnl/TRDRNA2_/TRDRNA2_90752_c0_seq2.p1  ORF type:complete len:622 (-),score=81.25 gnl/TRDRNA2_/TRDRNA2_90752_c0_seq2:31-1896(-)
MRRVVLMLLACIARFDAQGSERFKIHVPSFAQWNGARPLSMRGLRECVCRSFGLHTRRHLAHRFWQPQDRMFKKKTGFRPCASGVTNSDVSFVQVWDGVLDEHTAAEMRDLLMSRDEETYMDGVTHFIDRQKPISSSTTEDAIGNILRSIVDEIGDGSRYIEWWWRSEWIPMEAHRDLGQGEGEDGRAQELKCPCFAHVLYLAVDSEVRGPTCVFQDRGLNIDTNEQSTNPVERIAVVPAVPGRVLRFQGDLLHSVPRPTSQYLDTDEIGHSVDGDDVQEDVHDDGTSEEELKNARENDERLTKLLEEMQQKKVPDAGTYKAIVAMCEVDQWPRQALEILESVNRQQIVPDILIYNSLLSACEQGKRPERALEIFKSMQGRGIEPNIGTYTTVITACEKGKQPERALEIFETMQIEGIVPDLITYNALIRACDKCSQPERAEEIFESMIEHGVEPDELTYSAMIDACENGLAWMERSVVLFNTWDEAPASSEDQLGNVIPSQEDSLTLQSKMRGRCRPKSKWTTQPIEVDSARRVGGKHAVFGIPLLGDRFRRQREAEQLFLHGHREHLEDALYAAKVCKVVRVIEAAGAEPLQYSRGVRSCHGVSIAALLSSMICISVFL